MSKLKVKNRKLKTDYIIGIDEVGRGALAGPVTVAAILLPQNFRVSISNFQSAFELKLRDSKKLSPKQREVWFRYIKNISVNQYSNQRKSMICYAVANISPKVIDKINIFNAANLAASRALNKLITNHQLPITKIKIFLDGGLYLKKPKTKNYKLQVKTVARGDEKIPAIMLASVIAKVTRDRIMVGFHKKYPKYAFDQHKGYGTKIHIKAIREFGLLPIHRRTFKIKI